VNKINQKLLLLLLGGLALSFCYTPSQQRRVFRTIGKEWKNLDATADKNLRSQINSLYRSKLIKRKINKDGTITLTLTDKGKMKAITYKFEEIKLTKKKSWNGKWHIVMFDIPEKQRIARDIFRDKIKKIGFYELQHSVFAFPYECEDEIEYIIETYKISQWVRFGILEKIDNDDYLRKFFEL
jgi:DNA-binding transcriptional regulator PaaX